MRLSFPNLTESRVTTVGDKPKMRVYKFTVKGGGMFPYEMLRYDACEFVSDEDMMTAANVGIRRVNLQFNVWNVQRLPTEQRWRSFGWEVVKKGKVV